MNTVNKKEIQKFSKIANEWWDPEGKFKPLHKFNPIRIKYIKDNIIQNFKIKSKNAPLKGLNILDIGCGGGLLSEPMCRLGGKVTAIDASKKNIDVAKFHSKKNKLKIKSINEYKNLLSSKKIKNTKKLYLMTTNKKLFYSQFDFKEVTSQNLLILEI